MKIEDANIDTISIAELLIDHATYAPLGSDENSRKTETQINKKIQKVLAKEKPFAIKKRTGLFKFFSKYKTVRSISQKDSSKYIKIDLDESSSIFVEKSLAKYVKSSIDHMYEHNQIQNATYCAAKDKLNKDNCGEEFANLVQSTTNKSEIQTLTNNLNDAITKENQAAKALASAKKVLLENGVMKRLLKKYSRSRKKQTIEGLLIRLSKVAADLSPKTSDYIQDLQEITKDEKKLSELKNCATNFVTSTDAFTNAQKEQKNALMALNASQSSSRAICSAKLFKNDKVKAVADAVKGYFTSVDTH